MRPPAGNSLTFADQQRRNGHPQQQLKQNGLASNRSRIQHQHNPPPGTGRRVHIVDSLVSAGMHSNGRHSNGTSGSADRRDCRSMPPSASNGVSKRCQCCPFGFHIDLGFVKFAEDVAAGKEQIQNWSSPAKKRARRLLISPSSDRTVPSNDMSTTDSSANGPMSTSLHETSSMMSKSLDADELPSDLEHYAHQERHQQALGRARGQRTGQRAAKGPVPQSILRQQNGGGDWTAGGSNGPPRTFQHQSRYFDVQPAVGQQQRKRYPLSVAPEPGVSPLGAPLRTSTPREDNHPRPLHISTSAAAPVGPGQIEPSSAPSSPEPQPFRSAVVQSVPQLRRMPQRAATMAVWPGGPSQAQTSLCALSSAARNAFNGLPAARPAHFYLESGGRRRVLSPEPQLGRQLDGSIRSSNLQNRTFFHANSFAGATTVLAPAKVPYRSRGMAGSAPQVAVDLAEFASVRRRRLDADLEAHSTATLPSAHFVRSVSPPGGLFTPPLFGSPKTSVGSMPRWRTPPASFEHQIQHFVPIHEQFAELEEDNGGTLKPAKQQSVTLAPMVKVRHSGTQTAAVAKHMAKDVGIGTDRRPKKVFKETGTGSGEIGVCSAPSPMGTATVHAFLGTGQLVSVAVDTRDLPPSPSADGTFKKEKKIPPQPPPKPTGPELEEELRRRREAERLAHLVTEFQYCLGHEPEHRPGEEPQLLGERREEKQVQTKGPDRRDRGEDPIGALVGQSTQWTSTTELAQPVKVHFGIGTDAVERADQAVETEQEEGRQLAGKRSPIAVTVQTDERAAEEPPKGNSLLADAQTQTSDEWEDWLAAEIGRRMAEAETQRNGKRKEKRNSVDKGTETDEEELGGSADQFIMITCNKCEQRSSVASDELFEKIVSPEEDLIPNISPSEEEQQESLAEKDGEQSGGHQLAEESRSEREEEGGEGNECASGGQPPRGELTAIQEEQLMIAKGRPTVDLAEVPEGLKMQQATLLLISPEERLAEEKEEKSGGRNALPPSALSADERLLLVAEDDVDLDIMDSDADDLDRLSIETDAQTVICVEQSSLRQTASESVAARTDALRKLLTEPQRQPFQRHSDSYRSYRTDKAKASLDDLEYIADRHKSAPSQLEAEPSTPCSSAQTRMALKETISLKKPPSPSSPFQPPEPIPARIPRPKIARYSPNVAQAETPDEEAEADDRLTPLRSEMRSLSAWGQSSSPRMTQRALVFRAHIPGTDEEEQSEAYESAGISGEQKQQQEGALLGDDSSSTSSEGARTYEMSEEEGTEFELSSPLRDALETINGHLTSGDAGDGPSREGAATGEEQRAQQIEWAYKYAQHEWLKLATRKSANAELVEQFIDALEAFSPQLMAAVLNMTDQNGNTALHYAVSNENFDVVSVLLDSKVCRVDEMNKAGYSALMLGALCELRNETECAIVQRLFQMGNVNAKAVKHSQTALMLAASHGRVETTNLLFKCGADVNIQDVDGSTALMCAAEHGQREIVKILLKQPGIDASLTDCDNQTALSIAVENQHRDIGVLIYAHLNFSRLENSDNGVSV